MSDVEVHRLSDYLKITDRRTRMDKFPKRRRYKDNPYYIEKDSLEKKFYVSYNNGKLLEKIEVDSEIYDLFDDFEKKDIHELNQFDRHIEHFEIDENILYKKNSEYEKSIEEMVEEKIQYELLYEALNFVSDVQKRRIKMYYFNEMTLKEIAQKENCSVMSIKDSIDSGIKKLKKFCKRP
jgi:RNA polymerase sigma-70 factor (ECF subfamily)